MDDDIDYDAWAKAQAVQAAAPTTACSCGAHTEEIEADTVSAAARQFSDSMRKDYADKGVAMPDGSYPIPDKGALSRAVQSFGRASNPDAVRKHIIKRAKALGATDVLPADWSVQAASMAPPAAAESTPTMIPTTPAAPTLPPEVESRIGVLEATVAAQSSRISTLESTVAQMCVEDSDSIMASAGV